VSPIYQHPFPLTRGDDASNGAQAIVVEDSNKEESDKQSNKESNEGATTEEDNDAELGTYFIALVDFWPSTDQLVN